MLLGFAAHGQGMPLALAEARRSLSLLLMENMHLWQGSVGNTIRPVSWPASPLVGRWQPISPRAPSVSLMQLCTATCLLAGVTSRQLMAPASWSHEQQRAGCWPRCSALAVCREASTQDLLPELGASCGTCRT